MADKIAHEDIENVVVDLCHVCTDYEYSDKQHIASERTTGYAPAEERRIMIRGINFVGIPVRDQDVALAFYTEVLGFKVVTDRPFTDSQRWIELLIPGAETGLALYTPEGHESRIGQFQSIAFWCEDIFATCSVLKQKGVQFAQEPKKEPWGSTAVMKDPDGNEFALSSKSKQR